MKLLIIRLLLLCFAPVLLHAQNIGIGEDNPVSSKLQVKAGDSAVMLLQNSNAAGSNVKTSLYFKTGNNYSGSVATIGTAATHRLGLFTFGGSSAAGLQERLSVMDDGKVGINNTAPTAQLDVQGSVKISNGTQGPGKVLTSDASGNASWQNSAAHNTGFKAFSIGTSFGANTTLPIPFSTASPLDGKFNDGNHFNNTTRSYVAPADGLYVFNVSLESNGIVTPNAGLMQMTAVGTGSASVANLPMFKTYLLANASTPASINLHFITRMQAGDAISINFFHNLSFNFPYSKASFEGTRIY